MASIRDWAARAADRIKAEGPRASAERIAAIIDTFSQPWTTLLRQSERAHYHSDDSWYCCGKCPCVCTSTDEDHEHDEECYPSSHDGEAARVSGVCNCGADEWNEKVRKALL